MPFAAVPGTRALLEVRGRYGAAGDE